MKNSPQTEGAYVPREQNPPVWRGGEHQLHAPRPPSLFPLHLPPRLALRHTLTEKVSFIPYHFHTLDSADSIPRLVLFLCVPLHIYRKLSN